MESKDQSHVALIPFPFASHAMSLFGVARAIAVAAPTTIVSFLGTSSSLKPFKNSGDRLPNINLVEVSDGVPDGFVSSGNILELIELFLNATPGNLKNGLKSAEASSGGVPVKCVISHAFVWIAKELAEDMGVPWVAFWSGDLAALSGHIYTERIRSVCCTNTNENGILDFVPGLNGYKLKDLPEVIVGDLDSPISTLLYRMGQKLSGATVLLANSIQGLHPAIETDFATKFNKFLPIGPIHLLAPKSSANVEDPLQCLQWLNGHVAGSVAYVSFGSMFTLQPSELAELAQGLAASGVPFIWSLKDTLREQLPANFLDETLNRGLVVSWAPQLEVLSHKALGVFVTHCGWNSVLEAMAAGVPIVCRPLFADQWMSARAVTKFWMNGVVVEGGVISKEGMMKALSVVLREDEGKRMRLRSGELKDLAIAAIAKNGSSAVNFEEILKLI